MLTISLVAQFILLFGLPIALGFWLNRRLKLSWMLFLGGALAFVGAWVVSNFLLLPGELGLLLSSIAQMGALYLIFRYQLKAARTEREALMAGAGQAGIELILVGLLAILSLLQLAPLRNATDADLTSLAARADNVAEEDVEPSRIDELREIIDDYWNSPWYRPLMEAVQALSFIPVHIALAVIVLGALVHTQWRPLLGAIALHFLSRIVPIYGEIFGGFIAGIVLALLSGGIALWFLSRLWPIIRNQTQLALEESHKKTKRVKQSP